MLEIARRSIVPSITLCLGLLCMNSTIVVHTARAGTVPESAYSRSLGIDPFLLDDVGLGFRLPQLMVTYRAQALALGVLGNGSSATNGLGASAHAGQNAFFFLVQPPEDLAPLISGSRAFQLGWGRSFGEARLGVALRASRMVDGQSRSSSSSDRDDDEFHNRTAHVLEGALGFGYGGEEGFIDLVVEVRSQHDDQDNGSFATTPSDTLSLRSSRQLDGDFAPGVALRLGRRLGSGVRLVATGDWAEDQLDGEVKVTTDGTSVQRSDTDYHRRWSIGLSGTGTPAGEGDLTVFGRYGRTDTDITSIGYTTLNRATDSTDSGMLGVAFERTIWRRLRGLAGLRAEYIRQRSGNEIVRVDRPGTTLLSSYGYDQEWWSDRFGWGLAYRHDRFQLIGSIDSRLDLENLVLSLDARLYF